MDDMEFFLTELRRITDNSGLPRCCIFRKSIDDAAFIRVPSGMLTTSGSSPMLQLCNLSHAAGVCLTMLTGNSDYVEFVAALKRNDDKIDLPGHMHSLDYAGSNVRRHATDYYRAAAKEAEIAAEGA